MESVAPAWANRLASETVVGPIEENMTPVPEAASEPPVIDRAPPSVELAVTVSEPPVIDNASLPFRL